MKAAIYLRRSTDKQEYSMGDQEKAILEYANQHSCQVVERFEDDAISGTSVNGREGFKRMIQLGTQKNPSFQVILVYDVSRFSRTHPDEAAHYEFVLRENGVRVIYITEAFSTDDSIEAMLMKPVKRTMAHMYSLDLGKKVSRGMRTNTERGFCNGGVAPYGYNRLLVDRDSKPVKVLEDGERKCEKSQRVKLVPGDPEKVAVVRRIFDCCVNKNMGVTEICNMLNREGITPTGHLKRVDGRYVRLQRAWSKVTVYNILQNPLYVGKIVWGRRRGRVKGDRELLVVENTHKPLVSQEMFLRAAEVLSKRNPFVGRAYGSPFVLTGLITCKRCGFRFRGHTSSKLGKYRYRYYVDGGFYDRGKYICDTVAIRTEQLEGFVFKEIKSRVLTLRRDGYLERELRRLLKSKVVDRSRANVPACKERMTEIDARMARIVELCEMGGVSAEEAHRRLEALKAEKSQLQTVMPQPGCELTEDGFDQAVNEMMGYLDEYEDVIKRASPQELKLHVRTFVQRIEVDSSVPQAVCYFYKLPVFSSSILALSKTRRAWY